MAPDQEIVLRPRASVVASAVFGGVTCWIMPIILYQASLVAPQRAVRVLLTILSAASAAFCVYLLYAFSRKILGRAVVVLRAGSIAVHGAGRDFSLPWEELKIVYLARFVVSRSIPRVVIFEPWIGRRFIIFDYYTMLSEEIYCAVRDYAADCSIQVPFVFAPEKVFVTE